jgi:hypothetical protein
MDSTDKTKDFYIDFSKNKEVEKKYNELLFL